MYFKQILDERCGCASYLIASRRSHEAAIVDPSIEIEQYEPLLRERGFTLRYVIDTHIHADHVSGAGSSRREHGAELCLHESAQSRRTRSARSPTARSFRSASCGCGSCTRPGTGPS